ncbi:MAG: nitroreductase family protein [Prevotellaceae bacterium]|nr:nitroreductase family protein [Candidatus Minthosoma caballi]
MESIINRRTIRKYKKDEVQKELIDSLLFQASRAATMGNMQLYSVVVTRSEEIKEKLSPLHFNQPMVKEAPVVLTFCADFNRFTKWCELRNADAGYDNFLSFINAASDTLLYTQNFCTLAEEKGLGTCYLGTTVYNPMGIVEVLNLPKLVFPIATITVGWPDENPEQQDRLPHLAYIHEDTYQDYSGDQIDIIYFCKEMLEENQKFVEINKKENLAQVFTDCRYTREANESMSIGLLDALKKQGFLK